MKRAFILIWILGLPLGRLRAVSVNQITQYGITWTFSGGPYEAGQFINGDWWVLGPVTIQSVNPPQLPDANGSWLNPNNQVNTNGHQPFNSSPYTIFDATLRPSFPLTVNTPASLLSTIRHTTPRDCAPDQAGNYQGHYGMAEVEVPGSGLGRTCNRGDIQTAAVLTILMQQPPADAFRPPYGGTDKTIPAREIDIDYSKLGQLARTPSAPQLWAVERRFQRVNIETNYWSDEEMTASENGMGYGRESASDVSTAILMLNTNFTNAQKRTLAIRMIQYGLDLKRMYDLGAEWYGLGGHGSGRGFAIRFAGELINNPPMANIYLTSDNNRFGETSQTFAVTNNLPGTLPCPSSNPNCCQADVLNCGYGGYTPSDRGLPEWGFSHWHDGPASDNIAWTTAYRECCTANTWAGPILSGYIMGTYQTIPEVLRTYQDRYMQRSVGWRAWHPFQAEMWDAYRSNYARIWNPNDLCTEGASRPAPLQAGVCAGAQEVCRLKNWWGGNPQLYLEHSAFYQQTESSCDGRDNDCDGQVDEGCRVGNTSPQVDAGPDQSLVLPTNVVTLAGAASDDGYPNPPGQITVLWSKVSGPGTVTFANVASAATSATFSQAGTYVLRLSANDSALSSSDDIQITVNPPGVLNLAPQVVAGPDQNVVLPSASNLNAIVSDDGLPNPPGVVTAQWTQISGPAAVAFANATNRTTSASYTQAGVYGLRVTVNDGQYSSSDDLIVTVAPPSAALAGVTETKLLPCQNTSSELFANPCIRYQLAQSARVQIRIYSRDGKLIETVRDEDQPAGTYDLLWNVPADVASGVYRVVLKADGKTLKTKVAVLK